MTNAPRRHLTQIRPGNGDGPIYSPQRDLAYIFAPAMKEALTALDLVNWTPEIKGIIDRLGITEDDIGEAVQKLTEAQYFITNHPDVREPNDILEKVGWYETKPAARYLIYGRVGEVLFGGFFIALRDTSIYADENQQAKEIADIIAAGRLVQERSSGSSLKSIDEGQGKEDLRHKLYATQAELRQARDAHALLRETHNTTTTTLGKAQQHNKQLSTELTAAAKQLETEAAMRKVLEDMSFFRYLWYRCQTREEQLKWLAAQIGNGTPTSTAS